MAEVMGDFHFLRPLWLAALPLAALLPWLLRQGASSAGAWERVCDPALLRALRSGADGPGRRLPLVLLAMGWTLGCIALAGPTWEQQPQPVYGRLHSRVVLFDLSRSMESADLAPSRLERARFKLSDLVSGGGDREQALVVFAGDAFVVAPLTDDTATLVNLIPALDTQTVPVQGSRVDRALSLALELLERGRARDAEVILIADGLDPGHADDARVLAAELASAGHTLQVLGVGTTAGQPVSLPQGGFMTDANGNIVVPGLDRDGLATLAAAGGGEYRDMRTDSADIAPLNRPRQDIGRGTRDAASAGERSLWIDRGIYLLFPLLLLGSLAFRRGWVLLLVIVMLPVPRPAMAMDWSSLWSRPDQRAAAALAGGNPHAVPGSAGNRWQAAAAYRRGEFDEAIRLGEGAQTAVDHYNLGNAQARAGDLEAAAASYRSALELEPEMADADFNLDLVERVRDAARQQASASQAGEPVGDGEGEDGASDQSRSREGGAGDQAGEAAAGSGMGQPPGDSSRSAEAVPADDAASDGEAGSGEGEGAPRSAAPGQQTADDAAEPGNPEAANESAENGEHDGKGSPEATASASRTDAEASDATSPAGEGDGSAEQRQAMAQWLRRVPDDPGGLLRRKFHHQYSRRESPSTGGQSW